MTIETRHVEFIENGKTYDGVLAVDGAQEGARPCVLVCHAWGGRSDHEEAMARTLAEAGYVGFAGDVYGKGVRGTSVEENQALMTPLMEDRRGLSSLLRANLAAMTKEIECDPARAAVTGFCFGGLCALDMARDNAPVLGAAAFHALLGARGMGETDPIRPKVIAFQGHDDPMAGPDDQRAFAEDMTARGADWQLHLFGGVKHAFTNPDADNADLGLRYDAAADRRARRGLADFLSEIFGATA